MSREFHEHAGQAADDVHARRVRPFFQRPGGTLQDCNAQRPRLPEKARWVARETQTLGRDIGHLGAPQMILACRCLCRRRRNRTRTTKEAEKHDEHTKQTNGAILRVGVGRILETLITALEDIIWKITLQRT